MRRTTALAVGAVLVGGTVVGVLVRQSGDGPPAAAERSAATDGAGTDGGGPAATTTTVAQVVVDHRLFVVGDSVLQGAAPQLVEQLGDWELTVDTRVGRFLDEGIRVTRRHRRDLAQVAVVGLGNNYGGDELAFAAEVDRMLEALAPVDHILWLTVAEFRDDRREVNAVLRAAAASDHRVRLVDWNRLWAADPDLTAADRLHLTPAGAERMARLVADELRRGGLHPTAGAGRSRVATAGTLPPGSEGAVGDATPRTTRPTTSTTTTTAASSTSEPQDPPTSEVPVTEAPEVTEAPTTAPSPPTTTAAGAPG